MASLGRRFAPTWFRGAVSLVIEGQKAVRIFRHDPASRHGADDWFPFAGKFLVPAAKGVIGWITSF
jgi:hypothetical protein